MRLRLQVWQWAGERFFKVNEVQDIGYRPGTMWQSLGIVFAIKPQLLQPYSTERALRSRLASHLVM